LTAAHVINALPKSGNVGLGDISKFARLPHKLQIDMSLTGTICFSAPEWGQNGPDIGFLRLPEDVVGTLKARCLFRNLDIGEARFQDRPVPSSYSMDALAGVLDERTQTVAPASSPVAITREFEARFQIGNITPIPKWTALIDVPLWQPSQTCYHIQQVMRARVVAGSGGSILILMLRKSRTS
jgi:hypothetical protein